MRFGEESRLRCSTKSNPGNYTVSKYGAGSSNFLYSSLNVLQDFVSWWPPPPLLRGPPSSWVRNLLMFCHLRRKLCSDSQAQHPQSDLKTRLLKKLATNSRKETSVTVESKPPVTPKKPRTKLWLVCMAAIQCHREQAFFSCRSPDRFSFTRTTSRTASKVFEMPKRHANNSSTG